MWIRMQDRQGKLWWFNEDAVKQVCMAWGYSSGAVQATAIVTEDVSTGFGSQNT